MNRFSAADWAIVFGYFLLTAAVGFVYTRRAGASTSEFFIGGRNVPWWLAGVSMVATTFAADTPLAVTELVAKYGVAGNWLWWNMVMSGILTVFFFARLWRRANVMTDVELAEVRYGGKAAAALRGFRAVYLAVPINLIVLGWVNKAMVTILEVSLGINPLLAIGICFAVTVAYSTAAGLWAVLWTDAVQFVLMMTAVIVLAVYAVDHVGGMAALKAQVTQQYAGGTDPLSVLPVQLGGGISGYVFMPLLTLLVFLSVQWWAAWYPGAEPGGGGYVAQRIFAARTERDGVLATLFFQVAHYALRPWPWIITALASTVMYPTLGPDEKGKGYVMAYMDLLPSPLKGLMLAGFAAAYMSTVATQLNWGASYLVNDVYRRFLRPAASEASSVNAGRVATVLLFLASVVVSWQIDTIAGAWQLLIAVGAGTGLVLILRWYWWRVNAWSEISAMAASFVVSLVAIELLGLDLGSPAWQVVVLAILDALLGMALGLFVSAFANTEFQAIQFMPAFVFPQLLLCGLFAPRATMARPLELASAVLPMTYAYDALDRVSRGADLGGRFWLDVAVVVGAALLALALGAATLRRRTA